MKSGFTSIHPLLSFCYFFIFLVLSMVVKKPLFLFLLLILCTILLYFLDGLVTLKQNLKFYLFMAGVILILNPLFSTEGTTVLFYLKNRSITLEGVLGGITFALSLLNILFMFLAYNLIITPKKFLYLFGNIIPKTAFILTIIMGFIPLFTRRLQEIIDVRQIQKTACPNRSKLSLKERLIEAMTTLNTLVSWTLEESLDNAVSMRARGYGTTKRTSSTIYHLDSRDRYLIAISLFIGCLSLIYFSSWLIFASLPILIEMRERLRWHFMKSNT